MAISTTMRKRMGKPMESRRFEVEKGAIRRFAMAIGDTSPIHHDEEAALARGYPGIIAPITFPASLQYFESALEELEINGNAIMHAEEEYEYFKPIYAGDIVEVTHTLVDAYEKQAPNGQLVFVVLETRAVDRKSKPVFKGRRVLVEFKK